MSPIDDPIAAGLLRGWNVIDGAALSADRSFDADVVIVGSGAGGGVSAEILTRAGLKVLIVEEGMLKSSKDFKMREADAYPQLYQESAARKTRDKAINILQGRTVGGSTTVNWTSSFRTPPATLAVWQKTFGLADYSPAALAPWFEQMEARLGVAPWLTAPNENNDILARGAARIGIATASIKRNVRGCWNLGYCGMGCPTNAKQSMLVTTIPAALDGGATLLTRVRAERLVFKGEQVDHLQCSALRADGLAPGGRASRCAPAISLSPAAPSTAPACCCARPRPTRTACSDGAPSCTRQWCRRRCSSSVSMPTRARRNRSIRTIFWPPAPSTARSATSWKRRPCTRC